MDIKIAVITGTIFAGVLGTGALAAPQFEPGQPDQGQSTASDVQLVDGSLVFADPSGSDAHDDDRYDDDDDDDDRYHEDEDEDEDGDD